MASSTAAVEQRSSSDEKRPFQRRNLMFLGGGITGQKALWTLRFQSEKSYLRRLFRTKLVVADYGRVRKRYLRHYRYPEATQRKMRTEALNMGYAPEHVLFEKHNLKRLLRRVQEHEIYGLIVVSYGHEIEEELLDAVGGRCYVAHPCGALPCNARYIPDAQRGADTIEHLVSYERLQEANDIAVPLQIAMIQAEKVRDRSDPKEWDRGRIVAESEVFPGPTFPKSKLANTASALSWRVRKTQEHISTHYHGALYELPRILGYSAQTLLEAGVPVSAVEKNFGFTTQELAEAGFANDYIAERLNLN